MVVVKTASRKPGKREAAKTETSSRPASVTESTEVPPILGVSASAGRQEAFTQLLLALPSDPGMALVHVQHLMPQRESILAKLLSSATAMPAAGGFLTIKARPGVGTRVRIRIPLAGGSE